jgi:hypothetical protein
MRPDGTPELRMVAGNPPLGSIAVFDRELSKDIIVMDEDLPDLLRANPTRYAPATEKSLVTTSALERPTKSKLEMQQISLSETLADLRRIESLFRPEFLTYAGRSRRFLDEIADTVAPLDGQRAADFIRFTEMNALAAKIMNDTIRRITGAQMSMKEAQRIGLQTIRPANFDEPDSPTEFAVKLRMGQFFTQLSMARNKYVLENGVANIEDVRNRNAWDEVVTLQGMRKFLEEEANKRFNELTSRGVDETAAFVQVRTDMLNEWHVDMGSIADMNPGAYANDPDSQPAWAILANQKLDIEGVQPVEKGVSRPLTQQEFDRLFPEEQPRVEQAEEAEE